MEQKPTKDKRSIAGTLGLVGAGAAAGGVASPYVAKGARKVYAAGFVGAHSLRTASKYGGLKALIRSRNLRQAWDMAKLGAHHALSVQHEFEDRKQGHLGRKVVAGTAIAGTGAIAYAGVRGVRKVERNLRGVIAANRKSIKTTTEKFKAAAEQTKLAAENMRYSSVPMADLGRAYTGAKQGAKLLGHPTEMARQIRAGFRSGLTESYNPEGLAARYGRGAGKLFRKGKNLFRLSAALDDILEFKEPDKKKDYSGSVEAVKGRNAGTLSGAIGGAWAGGILGAEHGSMASGLGGLKESGEKFAQYAKEDQAYRNRTNAERYTEIENHHGEVTRLLKDTEGSGVHTSGSSFFKNLKQGAKQTLKELPTRSKYAAQDALRGTGKWLTRSSLSRSIAGGALVGAGIGRYLGGKGGESMHRAKLTNQKLASQRRVHKQATEIAKAHAMAKAIASQYGGPSRQFSSISDYIALKAIELDPKNKGKLTATENRTGKSASELKNSKNPKTRERATFAVNAKKFKHRRKSRAAALSSVLNDIIEFKAIDLGYTYGSSGLCDSPCSSSDQNKKHFPSLYVSDREQEVNLPLSGEAKVRYRMRSKTSRTNEDGQTKHSADIEIQSIDPLTDDKKPKEGGKAKLIGMAVPKNRGLSRGFKRKRTDQGGSIPGDCPGSSSELSANQEVIEFGKAGRLGAIAALVGTLAAGTAERGKIFSKLGIGGKALTSIESAAKPLSPLDALAARSKALAARSTSERMAAAKIHPSATPSQPVQASTPISNQSAIVAADSARKERDAAMASDAAQPTPTPGRAHGASGLYDPMGRFRKSGPSITIPTKGRNFAALSASLDEILFEDPRPRNKLGEFNGGQEGGADPNAMSLVYAQGQRKGLHRGLAEGAAAGVGGSVAGTAMKELVASLRKARK